MPSRPRRRVWCETVPPETLAAPTTVALLRRYTVDPILAVWPDTVTAALDAAARFAGAGLRPALWPMLPDADGRWISAANAAAFCAFAERLVTLPATEIVLDLEPPIASVREGLASRTTGAHLLPITFDAPAFRAARAAVAALAGRLHAAGASVSAAIALPILFHPGWETALGTPVSGIAWDHVSPMLYTSILEGWSRGLLRRADARALLAASCRAAIQRYGPAAGASLGAVGAGAFGDEPTYRSPAELADDVAVARAEGIDDLALFDLGGVLRRPPAEAWLDPFTAGVQLTATVAPPPVPYPRAPRLTARLTPRLTSRARVAIAGMKVGGGALALLSRVVHPSRDPG